MAFWGSPRHLTEEDTEPLHTRLSAPGDRLYFVWDRDGQVVGTGGIHQAAEIGYILHPDHWGQGLAKEGCNAIIAHVWAETDFTQITADTDPRNLASVGLLTRLGFQVSGYAHRNFPVGETWTDSVYFTLKRP